MRTLALTLALLTSTAHAQYDDASQSILAGWEPDLAQLELIPGEDIADAYADKTVKAIYALEWHNAGRRFVETHTEDGRVDYTEGDFASLGRWYVKDDLMCFEYDEEPGREHCFTKFRYGNCLVTYPSGVPIVRGKPLVPAAWGSVQQYADADFTWPDRPLSEDDVFVCRMLMS